MDMMLEKMLGVNPKQIQEQAQQMGEQFQAIVTAFRAQADRIESKIDFLIANCVDSPYPTPGEKLIAAPIEEPENGDWG